MKHVTGLLFFLFCLAQPTSAQLLEGYVITIAGDTLRGKIQQPENGLKRQRNVQFFNSSNEKTVYKSDELKSYAVEGGGKWFIYVTKVVDGQRHLLSRLNDGPMKLYVYYQPPTTMEVNGSLVSLGGLRSVYLLERPDRHQEAFNSQEEAVGSSGFRKRVLPYFSDCSWLTEKIQKKQYKADDMERIVREYNQWFQETAPH
jgi:hypothetical protein